MATRGFFPEISEDHVLLKGALSRQPLRHHGQCSDTAFRAFACPPTTAQGAFDDGISARAPGPITSTWGDCERARDEEHVPGPHIVRVAEEMSAVSLKRHKCTHKRGAAMAWLNERLAAGPVRASVLRVEGIARGYSETLMRYARHQAGIITFHVDGIAGSSWQLADKAQGGAECDEKIVT